MMPKRGAYKSSNPISDELKVHNSGASRAEEGHQLKSNKSPDAFSTKDVSLLTTLPAHSLGKVCLSPPPPLSTKQLSSPDLSASDQLNESGFVSATLPSHLTLSMDRAHSPTFSGSIDDRSGACSPPVRDTTHQPASFRPIAFSATSTPLLLGRVFSSSGSSPNNSNVNLVHVPPPASQSSSLTESDADTLYLQNVRLTEHLLTIKRENEELLKEKGGLVTQVETLKTRLDQCADNDMDRVKILREELATVQENRRKMQLDLQTCRSHLNSKTLESRQVQDELEVYKEAKVQFDSHLQRLKDAMDSKEDVILSFKNQIADLYTEMNAARTARENVERDTKRLSSELDGLQRSRDWYREQLESTQDSRNKLQSEINKLQHLISQGSGFNENLNHDNNQLRIQMAKMEQFVLLEKRALAQELENVRSDMIEREAMFEQILQERDALEEIVEAKKIEAEEAALRFQIFHTKISNMEDEIAQLNSSLEAKSDELDAVEQEKAGFITHVAQLEQCISHKDGVFNEQCSKYNEVADKLRKLEDTCRDKSDLVDQLTEEKSALEISLVSSKREKDALDKYMENLKVDMIKVEESFCKMRYELEATSEELGNIKTAKIDLMNELCQLKNDLDDKNSTIITLQSEKEQSEKYFKSLYEENCTLQNEIKQFKEILENAELKMAQLENENKQLLDDKNESALVIEKQEGELSELKTSLREIRLKVEQLTQEYDKYIILMNEHKIMTEKYEQLAQKHQELEEIYQQETTQLRQEISETESSKQIALLQKETEIQNIQSNLASLISAKSKLEEYVEELKEEHSRILKEKMDMFKDKLHVLSGDMANVREDKEQCRKIALDMQSQVQGLHKEYQDKLGQCFTEIKNMQECIVFYQGYENKSNDLSVELEKSRGYALGLEQSLSQVKEHACTLEDSLGKRESSFLQIAKESEDQIKDILIEKESALDRLRLLEDQIQLTNSDKMELSEKLAELQETCKDQLLETEVLRSEKDSLSNDLQIKSADLSNLTLQLQSVQKELEVVTADCAVVNRDNTTLLADNQTKEKAIEVLKAKEETDGQEIEHLRLLVDTKYSEIEDLKAQLSALARQSAADLEEMQNLFKSANEEILSLKSDLSSVREEKVSFQKRLAHLRGSLRAAIHRYRLFAGDSGETNPCTIDVEQLEKLLQDTADIAANKPLTGLSKCLDKLYSEMNDVQKRMTDHTLTVNSSFNSWRDLEKQALDLKNCCEDGKIPVKDSSPLA